jgi:hypothetical protein
MSALIPAVAHGEDRGLSVQDVMDTYVDPSADAIWGSVGTIETATGTHDRQPRSDKAWRELRTAADRLISGAQLLKTKRPVGGIGHGLADANTPGIRTPGQIRAEIDADPARFAAAADRLKQAGIEAGAAINARDAKALLGAGAKMDAACCTPSGPMRQNWGFS